MKKAISIVVGAVVLLSILTACGETEFECALCKGTFTGKANIYNYEGTKIPYCDDCYEVFEQFEPIIGELLDEYLDNSND